MNERFWFARRFPVGHSRNAMAPVTREGRMAFVWFAVAMLVGCAVFLGLGLAGAIVPGAVVFAAVAAVAVWQLLAVVVRRGDRTRTVDDYRRMRSGDPT